MAAARRTRVRVRGKGRRAGSTRWLERHLNDPYVQNARQAGYRARAAFKLLEIDRRFGLLKPGRTVVDLGSAPGSWAQVATARGCRVIGLDRLEVAPIPGATMLQGDLFDAETPGRVRAAAGGPADVVLSDMAAASTGQRAVDRLRAEAIGEAVLDLLPELLAADGSAVIKLVRGAESAITAAARRAFARVQLVRPEATHRGSSEIYLVAQGYRPEGANSA
ncbi:MAG TPA: RlmE family RNA methyltransferase [Geminicoccaceae bacterium]